MGGAEAPSAIQAHTCIASKEPGDSEAITVYLVIGVDGKVLCANAGMPNSEVPDLILETVSTWRFRPIREKGRPKAIIGFVRLWRK